MTEIVDQAAGLVAAAGRSAAQSVEDHYVPAIAEANAKTAAETFRADAEATARVAAETKYADHMAKVHPDLPPPPPPPPPPPSKQVFGTSYGGADESYNDGRAGAGRIFFQGDLPTNPYADADFQAAWRDGARVFVLSWKGSLTGAQVAERLKNAPAGATIYGCYFHEPEDNIASGARLLARRVGFATKRLFRNKKARALAASAAGPMPLSAYRARHIEHAAAMRTVGVIPSTILMQYTLTRGSGRDVTDYYTGDDAFFFDAYFNPAKGKDNPEAVVDRCSEAAKASGAKVGGLTETGIPVTVPIDVTISLTKRLKAKLLATPFMRVNTYWPSGDFRFRSQAHADAWFE